MTCMDRKTISEAVAPELEKMGCFLVDVSVSASNDIEIVIEKESGTVDMDDCAAVDHFIHGVFSQDEEDYSLTVSSAGLDRPFKVLRQFEKAVGTRVVVSLRGGRRMVATLLEASQAEIVIRYQALEAVEGKKKKEMVEHLEHVPMENVTSVVPYVEFE